MKNLENATRISTVSEPSNASLPDALIFCILEDMETEAFNMLQNGIESTAAIASMKARFSDKCKDASRILAMTGTDHDRNWAITPIFAEDFPLSDMPDPSDYPVSFPVGVEYRGTAYSYNIEGCFSVAHRAYVPSVRKMYADRISHDETRNNAPAKDFFTWPNDQE